MNNLNTIANFDKSWLVTNLFLERSDVEEDGSIRHTGREIYGSAQITLKKENRVTVVRLKNCEPLDQLSVSFEAENLIISKKIEKYLIELKDEDYRNYTEYWCDDVEIEEL